jgi:hypothetical protein
MLAVEIGLASRYWLEKVGKKLRGCLQIQIFSLPLQPQMRNASLAQLARARDL